MLVATVAGNLDTMAVLLEHGAEPKAEDVMGISPMALATLAEDDGKLLLLMEHISNKNPDSKDCQLTSLILAVSKQQLDCVRSCISAGCNVNEEDEVCTFLHESTVGTRLEEMLCIMHPEQGMSR